MEGFLSGKKRECVPQKLSRNLSRSKTVSDGVTEMLMKVIQVVVRLSAAS